MPEIVNPYHRRRPDARRILGTEYQSKHVGDIYDTSPYPSDNPPAIAPYVPRPRPQFIVTADWIRAHGPADLLRRAGDLSYFFSSASSFFLRWRPQA